MIITEREREKEEREKEGREKKGRGEKENDLASKIGFSSTYNRLLVQNRYSKRSRLYASNFKGLYMVLDLKQI